MTLERPRMDVIKTFEWRCNKVVLTSCIFIVNLFCLSCTTRAPTEQSVPLEPSFVSLLTTIPLSKIHRILYDSSTQSGSKTWTVFTAEHGTEFQRQSSHCSNTTTCNSSSQIVFSVTTKSNNQYSTATRIDQEIRRANRSTHRKATRYCCTFVVSYSEMGQICASIHRAFKVRSDKASRKLLVRYIHIVRFSVELGYRLKWNRKFNRSRQIEGRMRRRMYFFRAKTLGGVVG